MSKLALKLIREAKKTKAKKLYLGYCGLTKLPNELFNLVWLEELDLSNRRRQSISFLDKMFYEKENNIKQFPDKIQQLKNLKILLTNGDYVTKWSLKDLSPLKNLEKLKHLDVRNTKVSDLSPLSNLINLEYLLANNLRLNSLEFLGKLTNLKHLYVNYSNVTNIEPLKNLSNLELLAIGGSNLQNIDSLQYCKNLKQVFLWGSSVSDLRPLRNLQNLKCISISDTLVSDLRPIRNLQNLVDLKMRDTHVKDLSPLIGILEKGVPITSIIGEEGINVDDCPLTNPPIEIAKQGNEAILNYWKQIEDQGGTQTINEAKLIIVGEGGTGKTTLFNKLIDSKFDLSKTPTEETQGINIHEGLEIKDGFLANLWDFGGQELQYMTHQFFLTPNAVYVLIMAARGEAPNLAYWFKIISLLGKDKSGGKVSLIIVLNKKKGSTGMPQYQDLLKIYADDFDYQFIELDLAVNDKRWQSLKESIEQRLVDLPIVKNELPKQWNPIRESLREAAQKKPYIDAAHLHSLCEPLKVNEEADQFLMTEYLHQLGSVLHFQSEEDELMDLIVLSPEWVVEGVYTVLKNERIKEKLNGQFTSTDMTKILCANKYQIGDKEKKYTRVDAQKLIQLMSKNNFDICYKSESGKYVAAQLLPDDRPTSFKWIKNGTTTLQFRYQYPIMPKGLMSRLIVRLSDDLEIIDGQEIVWKKGAILNMTINGSICRVLMREEDGETKTGLRQIVIEVLEDIPPFSNRKYALQRVRQEIESLHKRWFNNIASEQIIPCNCDECKHIDVPYTYELAKLIKLKKGRAYCNVQEEFVPLRQLLEGVYEPNEIESFARKQKMNRPD